jgi:uncharacterized protein YdeI (BOF family)
MRLTLVAVVLASASLIPASAQTSKKKVDRDERARQELMQLERDIGRANVERDAAFFERVEADEFIFTDSSGGITLKKEDVAGVKAPANPDSRLLSYEVDDMKVSLYDDTAVVTGRVTQRGINKGREWTGHSRFTDVFVWRDRRWQIVAGHSSRIPAPRQ